MVRKWVRKWVSSRELPESITGNNVKSYTLLDDPEICAELRTYVRSNKWSMDPVKLAQYSKETVVTAEAAKYIQHAVHHEMPRGLRKYLEVDLFPRIQLKAGKGISIRTARRWLHREGFKYTEHKKSLYYDGHDRPDVVAYRQKEFIPRMDELRPRLVEYTVGNTDQEILKSRNGERPLVLVAHDEMTTQANDGPKFSWVMDGEHALKKKGVGRGQHESQVICSTVGWLKEAGQSLEYGKNYDGYWTGEMFIKQVRIDMIDSLIKFIIQTYIYSWLKKSSQHLRLLIHLDIKR